MDYNTELSVAMKLVSLKLIIEHTKYSNLRLKFPQDFSPELEKRADFTCGFETLLGLLIIIVILAVIIINFLIIGMVAANRRYVYTV